MFNTPVTRRSALKQIAFFSAALAFGKPCRLAAVEPATGDRHFLMIGDWAQPGHTKSQRAVASAMRSYARDLGAPVDGLFLLGDNFYGALPGGVHSSRWQSDFEEVYPMSDFPGPCWAMAGNHDYTDDPQTAVKAELDYADAHPGTRWTMPAKWYSFKWPTRNPLITCIVIDSNFPRLRRSLTQKEFREQMDWLRMELSQTRTTPWLACFGHHPLYSNGPHGDQANLITTLGPLFQQHGVDFYFCGHDHDLQHLEFAELRTSFVVSGGGGARVRDLKLDRGPFSRAILGFTHLQVGADRCIVRHLDPNRNLLHAFVRTMDGQINFIS